LAAIQDKQTDTSKAEAPKSMAKNTDKIVAHLGGNQKQIESDLNAISYQPNGQHGSFTIRPRSQKT
jgi:hypothetical protein